MVAAISDGDVAILEHVARYKITTADVLAGALRDESMDEAQAMLDALAYDGWLVRQALDLTERQQCFRLSERAASHLKLEPESAKPLSVDSSIERYAIGRFCCCNDTFRQPFTRNEFITAFGHLWYTGQPTTYYLESATNDLARLAFLKVDGTSSGRWDRLIASCQQFVAKRSDSRKVASQWRTQTAAFARLIAEGRFQISVLTALREKQRAIALELERMQCAGEMIPPVRVYPVPELFDLLAPPSPSPSSIST